MKMFRNMSLGQQLIATLCLALVAFAVLANSADAALLGMALAPAVPATIEDLAAEFKTQTSKVEGIGNDLKEAHKEISAKYAGQEKVGLELKTTIDKMLTDFNGLKGSLVELEQKMSAAKSEPEGEQTWGAQFVQSDAFKSVKDAGSRRGSISHEVKQVTSTAAGGLIRSFRENDVVSLPRERRVVRDLLRTIPINTSSVDYAVQSAPTNSAAPVAEAAAKPYSDYAWTSATAVVRTLAHLAKITRQAMDDAPRLMGEIDSEMRYGLGYVEERQFLYGTGVGQNLHGIVTQATAFASPGGSTVNFPSRIDVLRLAMLQAAIALYPADGIVLNDLDWALIELTKTEDGAYLFANPQGTVGARMWGLPVVNTPAMAADDFLVGAFQMGATVYDRMGVEVLVSTENADDFEKNLATMRAEERVCIAVKRPGAFITGDFTAAIAAIT